jgi:hypothetical protein
MGDGVNGNLWPRGAEWRKWDLHVHTPASCGFAGDYNQFIIQIGNADCDVIGINDYFSVAGYREVLRRLDDPGAAIEGNKAYRESLEKLRGKTLLPVVECRMTNVLVNKKGSGQRINFHLIFDPAIDPENIETFLKGQKVKENSIGSRYCDTKFLRDDVAVDFNAVCQTLRSDGVFKERFLIWLPYDEYGGIDGINPTTDKMFKENLIYNADILGSSNKKQSAFFFGKTRILPKRIIAAGSVIGSPASRAVIPTTLTANSASSRTKTPSRRINIVGSRPIQPSMACDRSSTSPRIASISESCRPSSKKSAQTRRALLIAFISLGQRMPTRRTSGSTVSYPLTPTWLPLSATRAAVKAPSPTFLR